MKRRNLLGYTAAGTGSALVLGACGQTTVQTPPTPTNLSQPTVQWRMATSWPKSLDIAFGTAELVCRKVSEMTDGRFVITPYEAGELVPGLEVLDNVSNGTVECGHTASYYYVKKNPALGFGTAIPFGLNAQQHNAWMHDAGGLDLIRKLYSDFKVITFLGGSTGAQMGGWFTREVNSVKDLKGLKMRIPGMGGQVMKQLGVDVQVLAGNEIFAALEAKKIEAAEWVGPHDDEKLGLNRIATYYYYPGWWEPGTTYEFQVNQAAWDQLPADYKAVFEAATLTAHLRMLTQYDAVNGEALERLSLGGTKLTPYSQDLIQSARKVAFELLEQNASKDATYKEVYQQWKGFRDRIYQWNRINEWSFASFAAQSLQSITGSS